MASKKKSLEARVNELEDLVASLHRQNTDFAESVSVYSKDLHKLRLATWHNGDVGIALHNRLTKIEAKAAILEAKTENVFVRFWNWFKDKMEA